MKKNLLTLILILWCLTNADAQKIKYERSLGSAKSNALVSGKPLAILITSPQTVTSSNFKFGWDDEGVVTRYNSHFINYTVSRVDTAAFQLIRDFKIFRFPSLLFLDAKGGLMFTNLAIPRAESLLELADKALDFKKERSLIDYDSAYQAGDRSREFLKEYISRRKNSGITNNADLIESYVTRLSVADLNNYDEVLFILNAGPILDSNAFKLSRTNRRIIDSIYKTESTLKRTAFNNATIQNSMIHAIANKNVARAMAVANFTRSSHGNDYIEGQKSWQMKMLQYYSGVRDTINYLQHATIYYDRYFMNMTMDSVKKKDSLNYEFAKKMASEKAARSFPVNRGDTIIKRAFSFSYTKDAYATELNNAAWNFYKMAGNNNEQLFKALQWSKRAVEFSPKPAFYDTYAHLLYKLRFYDEAESMERKAIESGKATKMNTTNFEAEYKKMKNKTL